MSFTYRFKENILDLANLKQNEKNKTANATSYSQLNHNLRNTNKRTGEKCKCFLLTQTEISEPENPSVLRAKLSKSLSVKLLGVSPKWTCSDYKIKAEQTFSKYT